MNFAQFAVNFESSICHCANWKMVCEFHMICKIEGLFGYLGVYMEFLAVCVGEWHGFCIIHNLKHRNNIINKFTMIVNSRTACHPNPALGAVCT